MTKLTSLLAAAALALPLFATQQAHAGIAACGDINIEANATCSATAEGGCDVQCEALDFKATCAAELDVTCSGECNATAEASCTGSCEADCTSKCEVDPPKFDCTANCTATAEADCSANCTAGTDEEKDECKASCKATASATCEGKCDVDPNASVDCSAQCKSSCEGSCEVKANATCQIDCQGRAYADCKVKAEGGCVAQCKQPSGALVCDGQFVDNNGNFEDCLAALKAELNITYGARGSASCSGGSCTAEGSAEASASCAMQPGTTTGNTGLGLLALGAMGALVVARRRRRS
ncbi:MAG: hypothetical protein AB7K71_24570 [Polyangiaceae bacterium]